MAIMAAMAAMAVMAFLPLFALHSSFDTRPRQYWLAGQASASFAPRIRSVRSTIQSVLPAAGAVAIAFASLPLSRRARVIAHVASGLSCHAPALLTLQ